MKLEKDAVTIVGFSFIFVLLLLIITPPILRLMLGREDKNNSSQMFITTTIQRLECVKKEQYNNYSLTNTVSTIYRNTSIDKITFTYALELKKEGLSASDIYLGEYEMLKQTSNAIVMKNANNYTIELDYSKNNYKYDEFLSKYSRDISTQKNYYNSNGYNCNVVK